MSISKVVSWLLLYNKKIDGFPSPKSYGFSGNYIILIFSLLGKSLEQILQEREKPFSLKTVCMLGIQMIDR